MFIQIASLRRASASALAAAACAFERSLRNTFGLTLTALAVHSAGAQFVRAGDLVPGPSADFTKWGTIASPASGVFMITDQRDYSLSQTGSNFARIWMAIGTQNGGSAAVSASNLMQYVYIRIDHKGVAEEPTNFNVQLNLGGAPAGRVDHLLTLRPIFSGPNAPSVGRVRIALKQYSVDANGKYPLLGAFTTSSFTGSTLDNGGTTPDGSAIGWEAIATDGFNGFEVRIPAAWFHGDVSKIVEPDGSGASSTTTAFFTTGGSFGAVATVRDYLADANGNNVVIYTSMVSGVGTSVTGTGLAFSVQPSTATVNTAMSPVKVEVRNADNSLSAGATNAITLSVGSGPVGGTLSGTTTVSAVNGTATFSNLSFNVAGSYTLVASSTSLASATSNSVSITAVPTTPPANTVAPSISGTPKVGLTLSAAAGTWTGSPAPTYAYQWRRCDSSGSNCVDIAGATSVNYSATVSDAGSTIRVVVTATNSAGSASATAVQVGPVTETPAMTVQPSISGSPVVGETLSATTGTWTGYPSPTYAYQWRLCDPDLGICSNISGATGATYVVSSGDIGSTIRVAITASNSAGSGVSSSNQTATVTAPAGVAPSNDVLPTISGTASLGEVLTASTGTWTGSPAPTYSYQWRRCDAAGANCADIASATSSAYTLVSADSDQTIRVVVTATNASGIAPATSAQTSSVTPTPYAPVNSTVPTVSGTTQAGSLLRASAGTFSAYPAATSTYAWLRCDASGNNCAAIPGATGTTYTLTNADVGSTIVVRQTATNAQGSSNASSVATAVIVAALAAPANTVAPTISGTAQDGQTVTANPGTWTGNPAPTLSYQWQRCDAAGANCSAIPGANSSTYTLVAADQSHTIRIAVTGTNGTGNSTATSAQTAVVAAAPVVPPPPPPTVPPTQTAAPSITGTAKLGETLTAQPGTWSGTPTPMISYQWQRCDGSGANCVTINGATGSTYTLDADDFGATIRVIVTAANSAGMSAASAFAAGPVLPGKIESGQSKVYAMLPDSTTGAAPADSVPADGSRFSRVRVELRDAARNLITGRATDLVVTTDGVATTSPVHETPTAGVYDFDVSSTKVNAVTVSIAIDGVVLLDRAKISFVKAVANLDITLAANNDTPQIGDVMVFTIEVKNLGPNAATGVEVEHKLSDRVAYVSSEATRGQYDAATGIWTVGGMALGESAVLKVTVTVTK